MSAKRQAPVNIADLSVKLPKGMTAAGNSGSACYRWKPLALLHRLFHPRTVPPAKVFGREGRGEGEPFSGKRSSFPPSRSPLSSQKLLSGHKKGRQGVLFSWPRGGRCHPLHALFKITFGPRAPEADHVSRIRCLPVWRVWEKEGARGKKPLLPHVKGMELLPRSDSYFCQRAV